jgi:urease accessory protein
MMPSRALLPSLVFVALIVGADPALAHTGEAVAVGLWSGLVHPASGLDHLVAMVAVGLWGAQLGAPAIWALPITFPLIMALGGLLGVVGVPLPLVEPAIGVSGIALGLLVALRVRPPLVVAALVVGAFAIFHGYAHGRELPTAANPIAYAVGFVTATGLLHLCGIVMGVAVRWQIGAALVRACGLAICCAGAYFLLAATGTL